MDNALPISIPTTASSSSPIYSQSSTQQSVSLPRQNTSLPSRAQSSTPTHQQLRSSATAGEGTTSRSHRNSSQFTPTGFGSPSRNRSSATTPRFSQHKSEVPSSSSAMTEHKESHQISFEWEVYAVNALKNEIERVIPPGSNDSSDLHEVFRQGTVSNRGWYKFDISRTLPQEQSPSSSSENLETPADRAGPHTISLFIADTSHSWHASAYSHPASIFVGIKAIGCEVGSRYGQTKWLWDTSIEWIFTEESEHWECPLPSLSNLLQFSEISAPDAFTLCVQIRSGSEEQPNFHQPDEQMVPHSLLAGLSGLLDSATGDVKFVCLEHTVLPREPFASLGESIETQDAKRRQQTVSRKRTVYAHSEILKARSGYFRDLLSAGFSESDNGDRNEGITTIIVDDAGFETVYWMLRYLYTNELVFAKNDDVRVVVEQGNADRGETLKMLSSAPGPLEWEYRRLSAEGDVALVNNDDFDSRTAHSISSADTSASGRTSVVISAGQGTTAPESGPPGRARSDSSSPSTTRSQNSANSAANSSGSQTGPRALSVVSPSASSSNRALTSSPKARKALRAPPTRSSLARSGSTPSSSSTIKATHKAGSADSKPSNAKSVPVSETQQEQSSPPQRKPDPHPHPCPLPPPASAFSIFILAHRYRMGGLLELARDYMLQSLDYHDCLPTLLATFRYADLHEDVLVFLLENWSMVQTSPEFLRCIQEVAAGTWGETGGLVLHGLFQRL